MSWRVLSSLEEGLTPQRWDAFVAAHPQAHLLQTWPWGELKAAFGWEALRIAVEEGGRILAGAQVLLRPLPLLPHLRVAYVPKGPLVDWRDHRLSETLLDALHSSVKARGALFLKIEPDLLDSPEWAQRLTRFGFRPSAWTIQPRSTIVLDLEAEPEEILARMKPKTRYNIRLSARKGVVVREGTESDLAQFYRLMEVTSRRDGFPIHSQEYYLKAFRLFSARGQAGFFLAFYGDKVLAGLMAFALADRAWYFYGASSNEERHRMPNYALQWAAILWARERGCRIYDLWGIPDEVGQAPRRYENDPVEGKGGLWGVYRFKRGFGGKVVRYVGAYDYVYNPLLYRLLSLARKMGGF